MSDEVRQMLRVIHRFADPLPDGLEQSRLSRESLRARLALRDAALARLMEMAEEITGPKPTGADGFAV